MCDTNDNDRNHTHAKLETWITPETSKHLSAKMVHLFPGDSIPEHTTGPGREEVLIVLYGTIIVWTQGNSEMKENELHSGETFFIGPDTPHSVTCHGDAPAQYAYIATKRQPTPDANANARRVADQLYNTLYPNPTTAYAL